MHLILKIALTIVGLVLIFLAPVDLAITVPFGLALIATAWGIKW